MIATRPNRYPQKAVVDRQKNVPHDSIALLEILKPAPPKTKLIAVTTNSAKNNTPPELPMSLLENTYETGKRKKKMGPVW